ncbi:LOW QUALITY PROTEIN: hypothetical protein U9M48_036704 [Paspalum notatum var. saurae]|uniref:Integrase catalytic domain-containing protein n=1 Tax=Paspalum notatum var. saurae TaxID=547442 RepID=A0AAQ3UFP6_PASNO
MIMAGNPAQSSGFNLRSILDKEKLSGTNFTNWYRNLGIVLKQEKKEYVLEQPYPDEPGNGASAADRRAYEKHCNDSLDKQYENSEAYIMIEGLRGMFENQARVERYNTSKALFGSKLTEGSPVSPHVIKMIGHIEALDILGFELDPELATDVILQSLPPSFEPFIMNYHMNGLDKTLTELHGMLKTAEDSIKKTSHHVMMVQRNSKKRKRKGKGKGKAKDRIQKPKLDAKPKAGLSPSDKCFHCEKKNKKGSETSASGINVIEINLATSSSGSWVFDTGSMIHVCKSLQGLNQTRSFARGELDVRVGNGAKVAVLAVGTYRLSLPSGLVLELNNCYFIPTLSRNIISSSCLEEDGGYEIIIKNKCCSVYLNNMLYARCPLVNGFDLNPAYIWHCRLGHINKKRVEKLHKDGLLDSFDYESFETCESCLLGKMTKAPFTGQGERASELLALVHTDVCGPMSSVARCGFQYFITFTDDFSRYGYIYLMRHKSESFERFKQYQNEVQNHSGKMIKFLRSDRGGEYLSQEFNDHLKSGGIVPQLTPPGTPQWNGVSERRNRTLLDMVRPMMSQTDLPLSFWGYALETVAFILNRVPSKSVEKTPYEIWTGKCPKLSFLKIWGCEAYVKRLTSDKLHPKSDKCYFLGYPRETKGYYFYNREEAKVFVARNGVFLEKEFLLKDETSRNQVQLEEVRETLENGSNPTDFQQDESSVEHSVETPLTPRRSQRAHRAPDRYMFLPMGRHDVLLLYNDEPKTYKEAVMGPDSEKWLEAMRSELKSMADNQVWNLVEPLDEVRPIECKWVFKKKIDADGNVHIYKARLVVKGFRQIQGVDYDETFSPVAMLKSIRILLVIATYHDYEVWQIDVKTAFLNGNLSEDVYMTRPDGFVDPQNAGKSWNLRFDEVVKGFGFIKNVEEPCVYKKVSGSALVFLVLYVDDILLIGNDILSIKDSLRKSFSMKDLGEAAYILDIKIYRDRSKRLIGLSQSTYIDKVLKRFNMHDSKKGFLPMSPGTILSKTQCPSTTNDQKRMSDIPYASAIGSIMYAMICIHPDVSFALSVTSRYQSCPVTTLIFVNQKNRYLKISFLFMLVALHIT